MPRKRNRDDAEEATNAAAGGGMGHNQTSLMDVEVEPPNSSPTENQSKKDPDDCDDRVELKKWLKEVLAKNADLESENRKLQVDREKDQQQLEKKRITELCCNCYSWSLPVHLTLPCPTFGSFYPNPNLVAWVEANPKKIEDVVRRPFNTVPDHSHQHGLKLESYSQMMAAFTNGLTEEQIIDVKPIDMILIDIEKASHLLFLIHSKEKWERAEYIVAGGFGPSNPLFQKAVEELEAYGRVEKKYGQDLCLREKTDLKVPLVVSTKSCYDCFFSKNDPVNVQLWTAQSYKSKVKGFLSGSVAGSAQGAAVKATFDLDTMRVKGSFGSFPFFFDVQNDLGSSSSDGSDRHSESDSDDDGDSDDNEDSDDGDIVLE